MMYLKAILAISLLVFLHELGHYLVARAFGMRVLTFSIGFGPVLARFRPRGSDTVFQIAAIPVLAYVQIAGMNPREETDPRDRGSYQNARPLARFLAIAAGPMANYLAASMAFFLVVALGGEAVPAPNATIGEVAANTAAQAAGLRADDRVVAINGRPTPAWDDLLREVGASEGRTLHLRVIRAGDPVEVDVTPRLDARAHRYRIGVHSKTEYRPVPVSRAVRTAMVMPAVVTHEVLKQLGGMIRRTVPVQLMGPVGMVSETAAQVQQGWRQSFDWMGLISLQLFIFNLLPIPALDGGRLLMLAYEMVSRRKMNPRVEAKLLAASLTLMLGLFLVVTSKEIYQLVAGLIRRG